jgi:hypothetical protein
VISEIDFLELKLCVGFYEVILEQQSKVFLGDKSTGAWG